MINRTNPNNQNIELGKVSWYRDYQEALALSKKEDKPILLFFQEIPGCSTCVNFGRDVITHPLMVEAIENEFIPLAIYNNRPGVDAEILAKYNEPSWNNPVAHFIDDSGKDIVPKLANNYQPLSMLDKMMEALSSSGKTIPVYIQILQKELKIKYGYTKTTVFETPCFWSGETSLAQHSGVYTTLAGFVGHKEVVKIAYDPKIVSETDLAKYAQDQGFYPIENSEHFRIDKAPQYYLKKSKFRYLPLSAVQRTAINYALPYKEDPKKYLSPKQLEWYNDSNLESHSSLIYTNNIEESWYLFDKNKVANGQ